MKLESYGICGDTRQFGLGWLLRLCWLELRLGFRLRLQRLLGFRRGFSLGLRLRLVRLRCRDLLRLPLFHQFGTNDAHETPGIRTSHLLSNPNHTRSCQSHTQTTDSTRKFPHLEFITPRSNLWVRGRPSVGVLEDLCDGLHLNLLRMFLR